MSVPEADPASVSTGIMRHRLLPGLAVVPLTLAISTLGPAHAASGVRRPPQQVPLKAAAEVSEPAKQAADSVPLMAGAMVAAASAAFAGTGMVRRRKIRR